MNTTKLNNFIAEYRLKVENEINSYLDGLTCYENLQDAMKYSVDAGGKRIRPLLLLAFTDYFGKIDSAAIQAAGSLEMLHTYSLIHDDLPEMDNDDLRRGKPTNHKVFGQAMAVLAGDGLLTTAFEFLSGIKSVPASVLVELIHDFALAAGAQGMVNGQVGDIQGEGKHLSLAALQRVHAGKTGALLRYSCLAGAVLGQADQEEKQLTADFGAHFGLAFQIYDDIQDVVSTPEEMGKAVHKDQAEAKNTYPGLLGLDGAYAALDKAVEAAENDLAALESKTGRKPILIAEFLSYFKGESNNEK